jgi:hypothetical protein
MRPLFLALSVTLLPGCSDSECSNAIISESPSPDGKRKVVLFSRECGATVPSNTQAMIMAHDEKLSPDATGNTFILDQGTVTASWKDDGHIIVTFGQTARFYKQESSAQGIAIEYQTKAP